MESALFVSWYCQDKLRGCLGSLNSVSLRTGMSHYALSSALEDTRFPPLKQKDFKKSTCNVNLLHSFVKCEDWNDWSLGCHGVIVQYKDYKATFLPHVAPAQEWTKEETIRAALLKAGCDQHMSNIGDCTVTRYSSQADSLDYKDWYASKNGN